VDTIAVLKITEIFIFGLVKIIRAETKFALMRNLKV